MTSPSKSTKGSARGEQSPKGKRLTADGQEALVKALYESSMDKQKRKEAEREKKLIEECGFPPSRKLKAEAQEALTHHLYTMYMEQKATKAAKRENELEKANAVPTKVLAEAELLDSIDRMYYQEKTKREAKADKLLKKYQPPVEKKKLDDAQLAAINERLFESNKGQFEKRRAELWEKHISPMQPSFPKLTAAQQAAATERLTSKA
mmetsp:Transcript_131754/g.228295  ORF Transcript_131754/g.228295 Transcript_131754/m.228295 type:complete len:207 (-) Transcript_131754:371-991(-)